MMKKNEDEDWKAKYLAAQNWIQWGYMVGGIAHEMKNPINLLKNFLTLENELLDDLDFALTEGNTLAVTDTLKILRSNIPLMKGQVERLLHLGQGILRKEATQEKIALDEMVEMYVMLTYHTWRANDAAFNVTFEKTYEKRLLANVFPFELGRALVNIVDNAFFTLHEKWQIHEGVNARKGAHSVFVPILHITLSSTEKGWRLIIKDNGMGMDAETQKNLLTPFYSTKQSGTGLGLFFTKKMIEDLHHGKMTLSSEKEMGTAVIFEVPFL